MTRNLILLAGALLASLPAQATDEPIELVVVTATRRDAQVSEISAAVSTTNRDAVISKTLTTDSLEALTGVALQQTTPGQGAAIVRGLKGSAVLHLVDGMRLNNAIFRSAPTPWFALVPASSVERLEVIRGTPASLYGSEAVGGIVQSVSRLPEFDSDEVSIERDFVVAFDTAEKLRSVRGTLDVGNRELAASISADYLDTSDRRTGGGERIGPSGFTAKALRAVVRGKPSDRRSWFADFHFLEQPETPRVDELVPGFGQVEPSSSEFEFKPNRRLFAHVQHELLSTTGIDWKVDAAWQRIVDDRVSRDFGDPLRQHEDNESDLYGLTFNASADRGAVTWIAGADVYYDEVSSARFAEDIATGATTPIVSRFPDGAEITQAGVFASAVWLVADRHRLSAGVRYTDVNIDLPDGSSIDPGRTSGDVGWIFDVDDNWQLIANVGSGFRAPNIADLGTLGNRPGNRFNVPNTRLDAETVLHGDAGIRFRNDRVRAELMLFALEYSDRIVSVATGDTTTDGRDVVQSVNAAKSRLHGVEVGARLNHGERIEMRLVMNYVHGTQRVEGAKEPADRVPPLSGRLEVHYQHNDQWHLDAWLIGAAEQDRLSARDVRDSRIDPAGTPGWARFGARGTWTNSAGWQVALGVDNVFDKQYRTHGSGIDAVGRNVSLLVRRRW